MQSSSPNSNSFIPKRSPAKRRRKRPGRKIFVVTIIAYSFVFAALLAAGASFLYKNYTETQLENEVIALNSAMDTFSVSDLERIAEFDITLQKATDRTLNTTSIVAVLSEIDRIIAQPIQIQNMEMKRQGDDELVFDIEILTDTLDAALFQRKILVSNSQMFSNVRFSEITLEGDTTAEFDEDTSSQSNSPVALKIQFDVPISSVLYDPQQVRTVELTDSESGQFVDSFDSQITNPASNDTSL